MNLQANGIAIEVDDQGPRDGDPLLLITGLGLQLPAWPPELVDALVARGHRVIRMDNRDVGLSQPFDQLATPNLVWAMLRHTLHLPSTFAVKMSYASSGHTYPDEGSGRGGQVESTACVDAKSTRLFPS